MDEAVGGISSGVPSGSSTRKLNSPWEIGGMRSSPRRGTSSAAPARARIARTTTTPRAPRARSQEPRIGPGDAVHHAVEGAADRPAEEGQQAADRPQHGADRGQRRDRQADAEEAAETPELAGLLARRRRDRRGSRRLPETGLPPPTSAASIGIRVRDTASEATRENVGPRVALEAMLNDTGYLDMVRSERSIEAMGREENLKELVSAASDFEEDGPLSVGAADWAETDGLRRCELFLETISLVTDVDSLDDDAASVTLMTLHNAKGLEFPTVFMSGMEDGVFPPCEISR